MHSSIASKLLKYGLFFCFNLSIATPTFAWSNYFHFINNLNVPLTLTIQPSLANVTSNCGGGLNHIPIQPQSASCEFEFETEKLHWYSSPANEGTITLAKQDDPNSFCTFHYEYTYTLLPYSYFDIHSEIISPPACQGSLSSREISVVNNHNQALIRPLAGDLAINSKHQSAAESTESLSQADCGIRSGDNCLIVAPDLQTRYVPEGSTLADALTLQTQIDRYEPLNFAQFIGSHNSTISPHYTSSSDHYNMSYADPDHFLTLSDQMNLGVRQIELDLEWYNNTITLCHNHVSSDLEDILCDGNAALSVAVTEIKNWITQHPDAFLIIYLDVNLPLAEKVTAFDADMAPLTPFIFTPAMASDYFHTPQGAFPAFQLSKDQLVQTFKKNIIIFNDNDIENLKNSSLVFTQIYNSNASPLDENSVSRFFKSNNPSCEGQAKYDLIKTIYDDDLSHYNIFRMNEYRTVIDFINGLGDTAPTDVIGYYTTLDASNILACPINILSMNMLGFTCDSNDCNNHPTDPRLRSLLWSWELGYPRSNQSTLAYIDPKTKHFANNALQANATYAVLCYQKLPAILTAPTLSLNWFTQNIVLSDINAAYATATNACTRAGGTFAVPTTAYWMNDVLSMVKTPYPILVNYQYIDATWIPNSSIANNVAQLTTRHGQSLVRGLA